MKKCLICSNKKAYPICSNCLEKKFVIDEVRTKLARVEKFDILKNTYKDYKIGIVDKNTEPFWDEKLEKMHFLKNQDGMTIERIQIAASLVPSNAKTVLDIGAGYGFVEEVLSQTRSELQLHGVDISPKAIENLSSRFEGEFVAGSLYSLPYKKKTFDVVLALEVLEHVSADNVFSVLERIKNLLVNGGTFILSVPLNEKLSLKKENPSGHLREYSRELIIAELLMAGFTIVQFEELSAFHSWYYIKRWLQKNILKNKWEFNDIIIKVVK